MFTSIEGNNCLLSVHINITITVFINFSAIIHIFRGHRDRDLMVVVFKPPMQPVPITTDVMSSNLDQGEVYNIM